LTTKRQAIDEHHGNKVDDDEPKLKE